MYFQTSANQRPKRLAIYVRKSSESEDRQVLSLQSQRDVLMEYATKHNLNIVDVFSDSASAHIVENRPNFTELMKRVKRGSIDGIVCWKLDRLARNPIEDGQIRYFLQTRKLLLIATPQQCYRPEDSTLPLVFELGYANQFSIDLSQNIKRGNKSKTKNGGWCSVAPNGYLNDRLNKTVIKDPERFHLVRKMFDLYLTQTHSLQKICEMVNKEWNYKTPQRKKTGGKSLKVSTLHRMLRNPFYCGIIAHSGLRTKGTHIPMITPQEHKKVLEIMSRNVKKGQNKLNGKDIKFAYTGLMSCGECGASITAEEKIRYNCPKCNKKHCSRHPKVCSCGAELTQKIIDAGRHYTYYRCTKRKEHMKRTKCTQRCIRKEALESQIVQQLKILKPSPQFSKWLQKALFEQQTQLVEAENNLRDTYIANIEKIDKKLDGLLELTLNGGLTQEEYIKHKNKLVDEKESWHYKLEEFPSIRGWNDSIESIAEFIGNTSKRFLSLSQERKKRLLKLLGSNPSIVNRRLTFHWERPIEIVLTLMSSKAFWLEPSKALCTKGLKALLEELYSKWCTQVQDLRTEIERFKKDMDF